MGPSHKLPAMVCQPVSSEEQFTQAPYGRGHKCKGQVRCTHGAHTAAQNSRAHLLQSDRPVLLRRKLLLQAGHLLLQLSCSRVLPRLLRLGCLAALVLFLEGLVLAMKLGPRSLAALQPASQLTQLLQRKGCTGPAAELLRGGLRVQCAGCSLTALPPAEGGAYG